LRSGDGILLLLTETSGDAEMVPTEFVSSHSFLDLPYPGVEVFVPDFPKLL